MTPTAAIASSDSSTSSIMSIRRSDRNRCFSTKALESQASASEAASRVTKRKQRATAPSPEAITFKIPGKTWNSCTPESTSCSEEATLANSNVHASTEDEEEEEECSKCLELQDAQRRAQCLELARKYEAAQALMMLSRSG
jgi:hypothetical protein